MPDQPDLGLSDLYERIRGGERVLIRRVQPEDMTLYPDFLRDVTAEDLRLRVRRTRFPRGGHGIVQARCARSRKYRRLSVGERDIEDLAEQC
jgi:hypothetical protein